MSRVEENEDMNNYIESVLKSSKKSGNMTYEQMMSQQLGAICCMLFDISKSLAVIADRMTEDK